MKNQFTAQFLRLHPERDGDIPLPRYMTTQSAGMDICAAVENEVHLSRGEIKLIPTGFAMALPEGFEAQVRPRSGMATRHGITVINSPGTIDADYRGEVKVALVNLGSTDYGIKRGERIAQLVIQKVFQVKLEIVEKLGETDRDTGGFGSTGK